MCHTRTGGHLEVKRDDFLEPYRLLRLDTQHPTSSPDLNANENIS